MREREEATARVSKFSHARIVWSNVSHDSDSPVALFIFRFSKADSFLLLCLYKNTHIKIAIKAILYDLRICKKRVLPIIGDSNENNSHERNENLIFRGERKIDASFLRLRANGSRNVRFDEPTLTPCNPESAIRDWKPWVGQWFGVWRVRKVFAVEKGWREKSERTLQGIGVSVEKCSP